ncbi:MULTISPECIES: hypothetical protein [unclassified Pseudomonas]|uniref:hypothetical protein n=1 Tax=unclassified Pseudomonas TaxID=196821 RepID=UPI00244C685F|nr:MULTISPECIES: hypothetical protein [unclassified Pseudomonas]MDG9922654.1 hypothetical protein [Pseudomonas sp. GD04045]MDH0033213.1 hypothetical protein [Pseudomonas sp. GD04019]
MDRFPRVALATLLLTSMPVLAKDWPPGVRETFQQSCVNSAGQPLGQQRAQQYCDCTVSSIDRDFSASEIATLEKAELPEPLIQRLQQVSQQCLEQLGGQG